jgi:DNA-binding winged helix-turn-helix (wHTH) protein/tetratricopeptide (TPR) repeat protein
VGSAELAFGPFRVDRRNAVLRRGTERIALAPKPFELLCCLLDRPGELVTKDELLDAVWPKLHVSESSLSVAINTLRSALNDDRRTPLYIETVTRRGYRLIVPVIMTPPGKSAVSPEQGALALAPSARAQCWVGRTGCLEVLDRAFEQATGGRRQLVFITGEAGIGKTTLIDMATQRLLRSGVDLLRGGCNELFGTHEAFLPLIEALQERCRGDGGSLLLKALRDRAPTWLAQMPEFLGADDRAAFQSEIFGATRERMLREFSDLAESMSAERPWVIVLEDLHWSDFATVDALSRLARRDRRCALLILVTYRPAEVAAIGHPVSTIHQDLQIHDRCSEVALGRLTLAEARNYLAVRFASADWAESLSEKVFARTRGQPLFIVSLVDHLVAQGLIVETEGSWRLTSAQAICQDDMPHDLRQMLLRQVDRLTEHERHLLETASAAGAEFSALLVAGALGLDVVEIEQAFEHLARIGHVLLPAGIAEWPNGMVSGCYAFQHALYQEVVYQRLAPGHRAQTHHRLGESLEQGYGRRAPEVAPVLALHFELGHDYPKAVHYLMLAAHNSAKRFSPREAASYLARALGLVDRLPAEAQPSLRLKLLQQRAWAWRSCGDFARSLEDLAAMIGFAVQSEQRQAEVSGLLDLSRFCLYVDRRQCVGLAEQALAKSQAIDDAALQALVRGNLANLNLMLRGWRTEDADDCRRAATIIAASDDLSMQLRRCSLEMVIEFLRSDYRACCAATRRGRELTHLVGDIYLFMLYMTVEAFALMYLGEWDELQRTLTEALAITERNVNEQASALCRLTIGWMFAEAGNFALAAKCGMDTLNAKVEANPFAFFVGKILLANARVGMGDLPSARDEFDAIDQRIGAGIPMESLVVPQWLLSCCEYWLAIGDLARAQEVAGQLRAVTAAAPDRPFLAIAHSLMARIAIAAGVPDEARPHLAAALAIVRNATLPLATRRVYAAAADLHDSRGEAAKADRYRRGAAQIMKVLTACIHQDGPLR